jgi:AraC family transcriptional regulator, arabinose operon regulatory protein
MLRSIVSAKDIRIRKILSRIEETPAVSVQELARLVKLSSSRLGHLFKAETGLELRHFLLNAKLERAAGLLRDTDMQIKEISHTVGYHHVPSFDRVFRKKFNLSPADYRRRELFPISTEFQALTSEIVNGANNNGDSEKC